MPSGTEQIADRIEQTGARAGSLAEAAKTSLVTMVENRRKEREAVLREAAAYRDAIRSLKDELAAARRDGAAAIAENDGLRKAHSVLAQNHRRLYLGFVTLLKSVEEACGAEIGVDQRIEATLLSSDIGNVIGEHSDVSTAKARDFLAFTQPSGIQNVKSEQTNA